MNYNALEWLNQNMHSNYPIVDSCVVKSTTGEYLPSSLIVDLSLVMAPLPDTDAYSRFFISAIERAESTIRIAISYKPPGGDAFVCAVSGTIPLALRAGSSIEEKTFMLVPSGTTIPEAYKQLLGITGMLVIGTCLDIQNKGSYYMDYAASTILSTRIIQIPAGLNSVTVMDAEDNVLDTFIDNFTIRAGDGIELSVTQEGDTKVLQINRVETSEEANATYKTIEDVLDAIYAQLGSPIRRINGISPDSFGNLYVAGVDCTEVKATTSGISISNPCSKPCCTDADTADAKAALQSLDSAKTHLMGYFEALGSNINAMQSRLSSLISAQKGQYGDN